MRSEGPLHPLQQAGQQERHQMRKLLVSRQSSDVKAIQIIRVDMIGRLQIAIAADATPMTSSASHTEEAAFRRKHGCHPNQSWSCTEGKRVTTWRAVSTYGPSTSSWASSSSSGASSSSGVSSSSSVASSSSSEASSSSIGCASLIVGVLESSDMASSDPSLLSSSSCSSGSSALQGSPARQSSY